VSTDPLDLFNSLASRRGDDDDGKDYPGNAAPRNRGQVIDKPTHEWLTTLPSHEYTVGGVPKRFYTIGALSMALNRKPVTIRSWESKGWLPPASFRTPPPRSEQIPGKAVKGRRLYSEAQIVFLVEAAITYAIDDPVKPDWVGFRKHITEQYPKH
jgi:hypothetical protein